FLPDGRRVVALVRGAVRVWDVAERAERAAVEYPADGDSRPKRFLLAARADGKLLAVAGLTDIQLFDPDAGTFVGRLPRPDAGPAAFPEGAMAFTPDGRFLVVAPGPGGGTGVHVWDVEKRVRAAVLNGHRQPPLGVAMLPGGARCVTVDHEVAARVWDVPPEPFPAVLGPVGDP